MLINIISCSDIFTMLIFLVFLAIFLATSCRADFENINVSDSDSPPSRIQGRVAGGQNAQFKQIPWHLSIRTYGNHKCSGALITGVRGEHFALTSANCLLLPAPAKTGYHEEVVSVIAGRINVDDPSEYQQERRALKIFARWGDLDRLTHKWDIALIALDEDFKVSADVAPIHLPSSYQASRSPSDGFVTVAGWGYHKIDDDGNQYINDRLQVARIPVFDWDTCYNKYYMYYRNNDILSSNSSCAGSKSETACLGDEGSPAVAIAHGGEIYLWGIFQWKHGTCPDWAWPGVYANVAKYVEWIDEKTIESMNLRNK